MARPTTNSFFKSWNESVLDARSKEKNNLKSTIRVNNSLIVEKELKGKDLDKVKQSLKSAKALMVRSSFTEQEISQIKEANKITENLIGSLSEAAMVKPAIHKKRLNSWNKEIAEKAALLQEEKAA